MEDPTSSSLDALLEHALRARVIDAYDARGLCVTIRCGDRTYTSSRRHARHLVEGLLVAADGQPGDAS